MKKIGVLGFCLLVPFLLLSCAAPSPGDTGDARVKNRVENGPFVLVQPSGEGSMSVEEALDRRISRRQFAPGSLREKELSQILWAAQGTSLDGSTGATRTAPSAGATHPLEVFVVTAGLDENGEAFPAGIYYFDLQQHELFLVVEGDQREALAQAALGQGFVQQAPVSVVIAADYERTTARYRERGRRYVHMEVGHVTQNIHLQAEALGLGSVAVGAFEDDRLQALLETEYDPLMIIPIGRL